MKTLLSFIFLISFIVAILKGKKIVKDRKSPWGVNKNDKKAFIIALILFFVTGFVNGAINSDNEETSTVSESTATAEINSSNLVFIEASSSEYARNGKKCIAYRVYIDTTDFTEDDLQAAYKAFIAEKNDKYYLHTVMVYSSKDIADGSEAWDVASLEEVVEGEEPEITYSQISGN